MRRRKTKTKKRWRRRGGATKRATTSTSTSELRPEGSEKTSEETPATSKRLVSPRAGNGVGKRIETFDTNSIRTTPEVRCGLFVHVESASPSELMISVDLFPDVPDAVRKTCAVEIRDVRNANRALIMNARAQTEWIDSRERLPGLGSDAKLSVSSVIASDFGVRHNMKVQVRLVDEKDVGLDFIEASLGCATSADIWGLHRSLRGQSLYHKQIVSNDGLEFQVKSLLRDKMYVYGGVFRPTTKLICRSLACELTWLVQVSSEMFEFADDGDLYWEKLIEKFMRPLLKKWTALKVRHSLTVVLFARIVSKESQIRRELVGHSPAFRDFYEIAIDNTTSTDEPWENSVLPVVRTAFHRFHGHLMRSCSEKKSSSTSRICRAFEGNLLEAINLTLNRFDTSHVDTNLNLAGKSIVIMTASSGAFMVDPALNSVSELRMKRNGVGCDMVCMAEPPLHAVPLFVAKQRKDASTIGSQSKPFVYDVPHWVHISFFSSYASSSADKAYDQMIGAQGSVSTMSDGSLSSDAHPSLNPTQAPLLSHRSSPVGSRGKSDSRLTTASIFGTTRGRLEQVRLQNMSAARRMARVRWPRPLSFRADEIKSKRAERQRAAKKTRRIQLTKTAPLPWRLSPKLKPKSLPSFPPPPIRLSTSFDHNRRRLASMVSSREMKTRQQPRRVSTLHLETVNTKGVNIEIKNRDQTRQAHHEHDVSLFDFSGRLGTSPVSPEGVTTKLLTPTLQSISPSSPPFLPNAMRKAASVATFRRADRPHLIVSEDGKQNRLFSSTSPFVLGERSQPVHFPNARTSSGENMDRLRSFKARPSELDLRDTFTKEIADRNLKAKVYGEHFNPFRPHSDIMRWITSRRQRWSHLYPNILLPTNYLAKWKSLCEPAILPLTTMHFPSHRELLRDFNYNPYRLSMANKTLSGYSNHMYLLDEMVRQRLSKAFQLAVREGEDDTGRQVDSNVIPSRTSDQRHDKSDRMTSDVSENQRGKHARAEYLLHSGRRVHQLVYDALENEIRVTEFTLKREQNIDISPLTYEYHLFCSSRRTWDRLRTSFTSQSGLHWNAIDELISGEWDGANEAIKEKTQRRWRHNYVAVYEKDISTLPPTLKTTASLSTAGGGNDSSPSSDMSISSREAFLNFQSIILRRDLPVVLEDSSGDRRLFKVPLGVRLATSSKDRFEWIFLEIRDCVQDSEASASMSLQLEWLSASHRAVKDFVKSLYASAKRSGLVLHQLPRYVRYSTTRSLDPFTSLMSLPWPPKHGSSSPSAVHHCLTRFKKACVSRFHLVRISSKASEVDAYIGKYAAYIVYFSPTNILWRPNDCVSTRPEHTRDLYLNFVVFYHTHTNAEEIVLGLTESAMRLVVLSE